MKQSVVRDSLVGLFVLIGLGAIAYLSISLGGATYRGPGGTELYATFDQVGGLKLRARVVVGGVKVGQVTGVELDSDLRARVRIDVDQSLRLPIDSSAAILTSGVLGNQYIELEPGAEEEFLQSGDEILYGQNAFILERMIGRLVDNLASDSDE